MFAASKSGGASSADPYFDYVTLLLPGNGTNGAQNNTFLDSSSNAFTISRNGNTSQGTFSPYGTNWSNYFDGNGDYLSVPDNTAWTITGDFTIEAWVYPTIGATTQRVVAQFPGNAPNQQAFAFGLTTSNYLIFSYAISTTATNVTGTSAAVTINNWNHIAVTRSGTTIRLFVNGVLDSTTGTASGSFNNASSNLIIGGLTNNSELFNGYISNLRIVNGTAVYTAAFTPPNAALTAITNTSLLTCQNNRFIDNSTNAFTITRAGDASVQRFNPFNPLTSYQSSTIGGSGYFDGSGDSLSSTTSFQATTSISSFTIEGWVYPTTFASLINIIGGMVVTSGNTKSIAAEINTSGQVALYWFDGAIKRCTGNTVMQLNAWNYFAIVVTSNAIAIYVNKTTADTLTGTTTLTNRTVTTQLGVGAFYNNNSPAYYFNGYLANLRVSNIARTISSVPSAPLQSDSDVRWLLDFTNAGIIDNASLTNLETVGSAQISTAQSKYGGASIYFPGSSYLKASLLPTFTPTLQAFKASWTVESWVRFASDVQCSLYGRVNNAGAGDWSVFYNKADRKWKVFANPGAATIAQSNTWTPTVNTWYHIAVCRSGDNFYFFVDGTQQGTTQTNSTTFQASSTAITIGAANDGTSAFDGYFDDYRITNGIARYTANFTPPQGPLPTQ